MELESLTNKKLKTTQKILKSPTLFLKSNAHTAKRKGIKKRIVLHLRKQRKEQIKSLLLINIGATFATWKGTLPVIARTNTYNPKNKGKGKGEAKGKTKGKGKGKGGKGNSAKDGRGSGNFPANYTSEEAYYAADQWNSNWESSDDLKEESSSNDWQDYNFSIFENENEQLLFTQTKKNDDLEKETLPSDWLNGIFEKNEKESLLVLVEKDDDISAWIQNDMWTKNNYWSQMDFDRCTRGVQPAFSAEKGGPGCGILFNAWTLKDRPEIKLKLAKKIQDLDERRESICNLDSEASRSVIQEKSPIRALLSNISETQGSCNDGHGASLQYLEKGMLTNNNEVTVVQELKYDLYAAVAAAKGGVSCVLDFDANGTNKSFLIDKNLELQPL
jgi:hypothetical protein